MTARRARRLSEMNQTRIGVVALLVAALMLVGGLKINTVMGVFGQHSYTADFANAGSLRSGAPVRVDGVQVGKVSSVSLAGRHVEVKFAVSGVSLGDRTQAMIKSENALGSKYLAITPAGSGSASRIPLDRTDPGISVTDTLGQFTANNEKIDVQQLARSFDSLSKVLDSTPGDFRQALTGVSRLSETISSRDAELQALLARANSVSAVLAERNQTLISIFDSGGQIFSELVRRSQDVTLLLQEVRAAAAQVGGLVDDNSTLGRNLTALRTLSRTLAKYRGNLNYVLQEFAPYARSLGEAVGSGPFYQAYIANLTYPESLGTGTVNQVVQNTLNQMAGAR